MRAIPSTALLLTLAASSLRAQRLTDLTVLSEPAPSAAFDGVPAVSAAATMLPPTDDSGHILGMAASGLVGGAVGTVAGWYAGYFLGGGNRVCGDDACGFFGGLLGAVAGESVGMAMGVHAANKRKGRLVRVVGTSLAIGVTGSLLAARSGSEELLVTVPVLQLIAAIAVERERPAN